jgi:uncharacterized membrane protein
MEEGTKQFQIFKQLNSAGNWSYFLAFYYMAASICILLVGIFSFINIDNTAMLNSLELSQSVQGFLAETNKYLVLFFCIVASIIVFINAYFLFQFRKHAMKYFLSEQDDSLANTYNHLAYYFRLNSFFSILSMLVSLVAIAFYLLKLN